MATAALPMPSGMPPDDDDEEVYSCSGASLRTQPSGDDSASDSSSTHHTSDDDNHVPHAQISVGTKLVVYSPEHRADFQGVVVECHPERRGKWCTINYDDGERGTINLDSQSHRLVEDAAAVETASHAAASNDALTPASNDVSVITIPEPVDQENPTIEKSPRGDRQREPAPEAFLFEDYEIYWESGTSNGGWRLYLEDREKVSFYSASFETRRCDVEWNNDGFIRHTSFRVAGRRKRKRVDKSIKDEAPARSPSKPRQKKQKRQTKQKQKRSPQRGRAKPASKASESASEVSPAPAPEQELEYDPTRGLGPHPHAEHPITTALRCTREEVIATLPNEMREQFVDCSWISWEGSHRPALLLSPFEVSGKQGIVDEWLSTYLSYKKGGNLALMPHLVYWYEEGWSSSKDYKAFSLVKGGQIYPFGKGMQMAGISPPL